MTNPPLLAPPSPYSTHLPLLSQALAHLVALPNPYNDRIPDASRFPTTRPRALELGCGHYSSEILSAFCDHTFIEHYQQESWLLRFSHLNCGGNCLVFPNLLAGCKDLSRRHGLNGSGWDLVFCDHSSLNPSGIFDPSLRGTCAALFPRARLVLIHDTNPSFAEGRAARTYAFPAFQYRLTHKPPCGGPWTTVMSNNPLPLFRSCFPD